MANHCFYPSSCYLIDLEKLDALLLPEQFVGAKALVFSLQALTEIDKIFNLVTKFCEFAGFH